MTQDKIREAFEAWLDNDASETRIARSKYYTAQEQVLGFLAYQACAAEMGKDMEKMREALQSTLNDADGCELNMSNYNHDLVHDLNNAYVRLFQGIEEALALADKWRG